MRVISGSAKGHKLDSIPGDNTRPILDRVKVALFDTIRPRIQGKTFLDLFAGSGSVGIEALSQGASHATFTELYEPAIKVIHKNLKHTKLEDRASVKHIDAFRFLKGCKNSFDLIFIAPPQYKGLWSEAMYAIAERPEIVKSAGEIIVQIDPKEFEQLNMSGFSLNQERQYGSTLLLFYEKLA